MEDILKEIGSVKCLKCDGICLLDIYTRQFVCQNCWTRYVFEEKE
jgi:hypothetical protein